MPKCFKCEKDIESAIRDGDAWDYPGGAVCFEGGFNFGSAIYDAMIDGIAVEILVCDGCLKAAGDDRKKEKNKWESKGKCPN